VREPLPSELTARRLYLAAARSWAGSARPATPIDLPYCAAGPSSARRCRRRYAHLSPEANWDVVQRLDGPWVQAHGTSTAHGKVGRGAREDVPPATVASSGAPWSGETDQRSGPRV